MSQALAPSLPTPPDGAGDALLEEVDPPPGGHALVIGRRTLETLCGLIRRGCLRGTELQPWDPGAPRPEEAQLAVLPDPASLAEAEVAVAIARRALCGGGRIAIRDTPGRLRRELAALLRTQGFVAIATRDMPQGALVLGEWPPRMARL
jgi:hypothetical protein